MDTRIRSKPTTDAYRANYDLVFPPKRVEEPAAPEVPVVTAPVEQLEEKAPVLQAEPTPPVEPAPKEEPVTTPHVELVEVCSWPGCVAPRTDGTRCEEHTVEKMMSWCAQQSRQQEKAAYKAEKLARKKPSSTPRVPFASLLEGSRPRRRRKKTRSVNDISPGLRHRNGLPLPLNPREQGEGIRAVSCRYREIDMASMFEGYTAMMLDYFEHTEWLYNPEQMWIRGYWYRPDFFDPDTWGYIEPHRNYGDHKQYNIEKLTAAVCAARHGMLQPPPGFDEDPLGRKPYLLILGDLNDELYNGVWYFEHENGFQLPEVYQWRPPPRWVQCAACGKWYLVNRDGCYDCRICGAKDTGEGQRFRHQYHLAIRPDSSYLEYTRPAHDNDEDWTGLRDDGRVRLTY